MVGFLVGVSDDQQFVTQRVTYSRYGNLSPFNVNDSMLTNTYRWGSHIACIWIVADNINIPLLENKQIWREIVSVHSVSLYDFS